MSVANSQPVVRDDPSGPRRTSLLSLSVANALSQSSIPLTSRLKSRHVIDRETCTTNNTPPLSLSASVYASV